MGHQPQLQILYWRTQSMTIWSPYLYHDEASLEELLVWNEDVNDATHAFPLAYCTGWLWNALWGLTTIHIQVAMKDGEGEHKTQGISSVPYNWMAKIEDSYGSDWVISYVEFIAEITLFAISLPGGLAILSGAVFLACCWTVLIKAGCRLLAIPVHQCRNYDFL